MGQDRSKLLSSVPPGSSARGCYNRIQNYSMFCVKQKMLKMLQQCNNCDFNCWQFTSSCGQLIQQHIYKDEENSWCMLIIMVNSGIIFTKLDQETGSNHYYSFIISNLFSGGGCHNGE